MTGSRPTRGVLARYLRQQGELAGGELFLDDLTASEALRLASLPPPRPGAAPRTPGERLPEPAGGSTPGAGYDALREQALSCTACDLSRTRQHVVFADGDPGADLMVVGEAPGAQEDKTGKAFVGPAGKLLDLLLATVDLSRQNSVYICNVLKCRPPGNRNPLPEEILACTPFLKRQIQLVCPRAILAVGSFAAHFLTERSSALGKLRGEIYSYQGVPVVVTYHPAALLRNSGYIRPTWDDLQLLRQVMRGV